MTDKATARLVRGLPRTGAVVVVASLARQRELQREIAVARGTAMAKLIAVRVITDEDSAMRALAGISTTILIDAGWRMATSPALVEMVDLLADCAAIYATALARLGGVRPATSTIHHAR